jgi:hypothetical protein
LVPLLLFMAELLTASNYVDILGTLVQPMIQKLFSNNDAVFQ